MLDSACLTGGQKLLMADQAVASAKKVLEREKILFLESLYLSLNTQDAAKLKTCESTYKNATKIHV